MVPTTAPMGGVRRISDGIERAVMDAKSLVEQAQIESEAMRDQPLPEHVPAGRDRTTRR